MAETIFIKFCGFIVHSYPNNMALSDFPGKIFNFRPTLKIEGSLRKKHADESEWQIWNFTNMINCFCCYVIKSAGETAKKSIVISHLKSTAYKNKSLKLGYCALNARKYVRCTRTFYLLPLLAYTGSEWWLGFPDQKSWWNWYLTPVVNFGEVQRAQLAKSTLLTSSLVLLEYFQIF